MLFRVNPIATTHKNAPENLSKGSLELIAKIDSSNLAKMKNLKLTVGHYKVVCLPGNTSITCELTKKTQTWRNRLGFVNLVTLGLGQLINSIKNSKGLIHPLEDSSIKADFSEEETKVWHNLKKSDREQLDSIFGSEIFEHGLSRAKLSQEFSKTTEDLLTSETTTDKDLVKSLRDLVLKETGVQSQQENFEKFCNALQDKIQSKVSHHNLGQEVGMWCVQSLFIVLLKHNGNLDELIMDLKEEVLQISDMHVKLWKNSTSLRSVIRAYESKERYANFFLKISYLLSLSPSDKFLQIDLNPGGLNDLELSMSPAKEQQSPDRKKKMDQIEKVKNYLTQLRTGQTIDELGQKLDNSTEARLFRYIFGFVTTQARAADILTVLEHRRF